MARFLNIPQKVELVNDAFKENVLGDSDEDIEPPAESRDIRKTCLNTRTRMFDPNLGPGRVW